MTTCPNALACSRLSCATSLLALLGPASPSIASYQSRQVRQGRHVYFWFYDCREGRGRGEPSGSAAWEKPGRADEGGEGKSFIKLTAVESRCSYPGMGDSDVASVAAAAAAVVGEVGEGKTGD